MADDDASSPLNRQLRLITVAGSLAMVYVTCVSSPLTTEFFRSLGATDFQFGLLGGLPMIMLVMQFVGAYLANRVRHRRPWFLIISIMARLMYLPVAFLPLFVQGDVSRIIPVLIVFMALSGAFAMLVFPMWFSWMGDLIPRRVLNRYFGVRQRYMTIMWTVAYLTIAAFMWAAERIPIGVSFPIVVGIGVAAGVIDILLFLRIDEPENERTEGVHPFEVLMEPLRDRTYRTFVRFRCAFSFAVMFGAAFMQIYVLKILRVPVWQATLIWAMAGVGQAIVAPSWGRLADRFGHRPIVRISISMKSVVCLVYLVVQPEWAVPVLLITTFFDSMLNSGHQIAMSGYMLNMAPRRNRSMFIAAITALAAIVGGVSAIIAGTLLEATAGFSIEPVRGWTWTNYHVIFLLSFIMRLACVPIAGTIREPKSARSMVVINYMRGHWPMRMLLFPVGLYSRLSGNGEDDGEPEDSESG